LIVANDVSTGSGVFGGSKNRVSLVTKDKVEPWPEMPKEEISTKLVARLAELCP
jgi:phosphopantothenoylcysteine decarboxylase/phosphopantothenate--cysteine ligase